MTQERIKTKTQKEIFLSRIEDVPVVSAVCAKTGVAKSNIYRWLKDDPEFNDLFIKAIRKGERNINDLAISVIIQNLKNNHLAAAKFWLNHKHQDFMSEKVKKRKITEVEPIKLMITTVNKIGKRLKGR